MPLVADLGERALIERIRDRVPKAPDRLVVGIGDDAAVAVPERGAFEIATIDALVEGVHFDRSFSSATDVGFKAIAVNASDIAAMGGAPRLALLSLILPPSLPLEDLDGLIEGVLEMTHASGVAVAGGNISRSPGPLILDVAMLGSVRRRKVLTRGGGGPGDALYVTGTIGAAAAGLEWLRASTRQAPPPCNEGAGATHARFGVEAGPAGPGDVAAGPGQRQEAAQAPPLLAECVARHRRPEPRLRIGALLGRNRAASACMDLSDGLADAVSQMAAASGTGATIDAAALPIHPGARSWFAEAGRDPVDASLSGSDDYELLFAVPARAQGRFRSVTAQARGVQITRIGELTADQTIQLVRNGRTEPLPVGFCHF